MAPLKPIRSIALLGIVAALVAVPAGARSLHPGSTLPYIGFNTAFLFLIAVAIPRPRSYAFGCFATFLALGFWFKYLVHRIVDYPFVEPIGDFVDGPEAWDRVLIWSTAAALGAAVPRCIQLIVLRRRGGKLPQAATPEREPPIWFIRHRSLVWAAALFVIAVVAIINAHEAIYRIGIDTHTRLPRPLPLVIAWIVNLGGGLVMTTLLHWERLRTSTMSVTVWLAAIGEAIFSSASAMSRALYLLRMLPYSFATDGAQRTPFSRGISIVVLVLAGFAVSMLLVTAQRMNDYLAAARLSESEQKPTVTATVTLTDAVADRVKTDEPPLASSTDRNQHLLHSVRQVAMLATDRWIGLEGIMAVSAHRELGPGALRQALTDDPRRGYDTLFQSTARSPYLKLAAIDRYTFLTLPGIAALCAYGGSAFYVFFGVLLVTAIMMCLEAMCFRLTGNPYLTALVALNLAYVVHQMNFPYLTLVYIAELMFSIGAIELVARVPWTATFKRKVAT